MIPIITEDKEYRSLTDLLDSVSAEAAADAAEHKRLTTLRDSDEANFPVEYRDDDGNVISEAKARQLDEGYPRRPVYRFTPLAVVEQRSRLSEEEKRTVQREHPNRVAAIRARITRDIEGQEAYKKAVTEFVSDACAAMEPALQLRALLDAGRGHGYNLVPMPQTLYAEVDQLAAFCRESIKRNVLKRGDVPESLRVFL